MTDQQILTNYMKRTGQDEGDIFSGAFQYGRPFIMDLVKKAEKEQKMIVWTPDPAGWKEEGWQKYALK